MVRISTGFLLASSRGACCAGTPVAFHNASLLPPGAVEMFGSRSRASLGALARVPSLTAQVFRAGESGRAVSFLAKERRFYCPRQDHVEAGGSGQVLATVNRDLSVSVGQETGL